MGSLFWISLAHLDTRARVVFMSADASKIVPPGLVEVSIAVSRAAPYVFANTGGYLGWPEYRVSKDCNAYTGGPFVNVLSRSSTAEPENGYIVDVEVQVGDEAAPSGTGWEMIPGDLNDYSFGLPIINVVIPLSIVPKLPECRLWVRRGGGAGASVPRRVVEIEAYP